MANIIEQATNPRHKRADYEGTIDRLPTKKPTWRLRMRVRLPGEKARRISKTFPSYAEADAYHYCGNLREARLQLLNFPRDHNNLQQ